MDLGLRGGKALVTGGTRAIGRAIAETFTSEGASVAICARNGAVGRMRPPVQREDQRAAGHHLGEQSRYATSCSRGGRSVSCRPMRARRRSRANDGRAVR
jgi:NAD(P)-dependent dehydrogenase (short-subunit alcohol dehydrogenase family)